MEHHELLATGTPAATVVVVGSWSPTWLDHVTTFSYLFRESKLQVEIYHPNTYPKINGATIVASDSIMYFGVSTPSLPQVIFSFGTAPE